MKLISAVVISALCGLAGTLAEGQAPIITNIQIAGGGCAFTAGSDAPPCSIGPGMVLEVFGQNFSETPFGVGLCDCPNATILRWTPTKITVTVDEVNPESVIRVENWGGAYSNAIPYVALPPVITAIEVGQCTFVPNKSRNLCDITPGTQVTIHGNYFGRYPGQVATCDCPAATINSWNPDWATDPKQFNNTIVATAVEAAPGDSVLVDAGYVWSNAVPYTTCTQ